MDHEFPYDGFEQYGIRVLRPEDFFGPHPLNNCGPMQIAIERDEPCPTCGVLTGHVPTTDELAEVRSVFPGYPNGFWA